MVNVCNSSLEKKNCLYIFPHSILLNDSSHYWLVSIVVEANQRLTGLLLVENKTRVGEGKRERGK